MNKIETCPDCDGTPEFYEQIHGRVCPSCFGTGVIGDE